MPIKIIDYEEEHEPRIRELNQRVCSSGMRFPEHHRSQWLPPTPGLSLWQQYFVAIDSGHELRGAYILKHQEFLLNGQSTNIGDYQLPLSEGIVNRAHALVGVHLYQHAIKRQPLLYGLGVGSLQEPIARMFTALKWKCATIPFYFQIEHGARCLRELSPVRRSVASRLAANMIAGSGLGSFGFSLVHWSRDRHRTSADVTTELIETFGDWADDIFHKHSQPYRLIAIRNRLVLNHLYTHRSSPGAHSGSAKSPFLRVLVCRKGEPIGWAVLLATQMENHKYFGNLRVGTIVDLFAGADDAVDVVTSARSVLRDHRVDLILTNQSHRIWTSAFARSGFLKGPSNFFLFASPVLASQLVPFDEAIASSHFTRGDGDGPINL